MNENKMNQLFAAARNQTAPLPSAGFAADVSRAVRREPPLPPALFSICDQLDFWFPRLALAAVAVIVLCVAADFGLTAAGLPEVGDGAAQASAQFLFNADDL